MFYISYIIVLAYKLANIGQISRGPNRAAYLGATVPIEGRRQARAP
jgi:hypothetical protein